MNLSEPRIRTQATHGVDVRIEDGPVLDYPAWRGKRFRVDRLGIRYVDGLLVSVEVTGPLLNIDGSPNGRGQTGSRDYETRDGGALIEETPEWVREVVAAHPWPGSSLDSLAKAWAAGYDAGDLDASVARTLALGYELAEGQSPEPTRNPYA